MRTRLTDDEEAVREVFAGFFANESPIEVVRAAEPLGHDPELWSKLAATGAPGMALPEPAGGGDADLRDLAVVVEQWGTHLAPVPLVEHAVTARLLHAVGADVDLVGVLAAGERIGTLALRPPIDGTARLVPAGAVAEVIVAGAGDSLAITESAAPGVARRTTGDLPLADRDLTGAAAVVGGHVGAWDRALDEWRALMAIAHVGLARRAIEIGVAYVTERYQFDVPVGTFQAVQHGLADASTKLEGANLLAQRALWALDTNQPEASRLAGMAHLFSSETARFATDRSLQYHGGYGYAEEYDIQLSHRRATSWILQLGDPALEYARLADAELGPRRAA
jgi:alkylation response protein AidB-like acyl-CoA dehydrogenase